MNFRLDTTVFLVSLVACWMPIIAAAQAPSSPRQAVAQETPEARQATREVKRAVLKATDAETRENPDRLAAPDTKPLKYICMSGNCACAGVEDCVDMKDICMPATLGCNEHGCTCAQADTGGDGGDGG